MGAETVAGDELSGLPAMLTVVEAARVLRIGRTLAYQLATEFLEGRDGLPVVRLGGVLRVPREALRPLLTGEITQLPATPGETSPVVPVASRPDARRHDGQLRAVPLALALED